MKRWTSRSKNRRNLKGVFVALLVVGVFVGCTTRSGHEWLSTFFDGVPDPNAPKPTNGLAQQFDENGKPLAGEAFRKSTNLAAAPRPFFVAHPPYEEKKCSECHESRFSVK